MQKDSTTNQERLLRTRGGRATDKKRASDGRHTDALRSSCFRGTPVERARVCSSVVRSAFGRFLCRSYCVCSCGVRARRQIARRLTGGSQRRRIVEEFCSAYLTPLVDFEWWSSPHNAPPAPRPLAASASGSATYYIHPPPHFQKNISGDTSRYRRWTRRLDQARHWGYLVVRGSGEEKLSHE